MNTENKLPRNLFLDDDLEHEIWVTEFTTEAAIDFTNKVKNFSQKNPNKPIIVNINSYGGAVDALSAMVSAMDSVPNAFITYASGSAMSCGAILLSHGDMRFCDPHARVMVHRVSAATWGDSDDMKNDVAEIERMNRYWLGFLAINCNMAGGYDELESLMKSKDGRDRYLTAEEALEMGIIDVVGRPKVISATIYEVAAGPEKMPIQKRARLRQQQKEEQEAEAKVKKPSKKKKKTRRKAK